MKPLSAAPVEGSPDRKQPRSSLSTALSSGLEKLKTVTSGSVQPMAPASQVGQTVDTKRLKVRPSWMPWGSVRRVLGGEGFRNRVLGGVQRGAGLVPCQSPKPVRPFLALATGSSGAGGGVTGVSVAGQAVRPKGALLTLVPSALRMLVC